MRAKVTLVDPTYKPPIRPAATLGLQMKAVLQAKLPPVKNLNPDSELGILMKVKLTKSNS